MTNEELYLALGGKPLAFGLDDPAWYFGWIPRSAQIEALFRDRQIRLFSDGAKSLAGTGAGKTVLLYEAARKVWGMDLDIGPQKIGDCVSWAYAGCVDLLACVEVIAGQSEEHSWDLRTCTEAIYALSRVEFGNFDGSYQDGSYGGWAQDAVRVGGTLSREYLGEYDSNRAREWGANGLPDQLEPEAKRHTIRRTSLILTYEEGRDAIANGYPIAVCSDRGFKLERDHDGFANPQGTWYHCMKFIGSKDDHRPGLLCMNSWGSNVHIGPKGDHDIPEGSFWVDAEVCTQMFNRWKDSYALSQFDGYPQQPIVSTTLSPQITRN